LSEFQEITWWAYSYLARNFGIQTVRGDASNLEEKEQFCFGDKMVSEYFSVSVEGIDEFYVGYVCAIRRMPLPAASAARPMTPV
jgi:hypothetical protein